MAPRETANNAYAKFWDDKQKVLWCVVVFSGVVNSVHRLKRLKSTIKISVIEHRSKKVNLE